VVLVDCGGWSAVPGSPAALPGRAHRRRSILSRPGWAIHERCPDVYDCPRDPAPPPPHPPPARPGRRCGARRGLGHPGRGRDQKAFLPLAGRSIAAWGLNTLAAVEGVGLLVFVVRPDDLEHARFVDARETDVPLEIITGGETRQ